MFLEESKLRILSKIIHLEKQAGLSTYISVAKVTIMIMTTITITITTTTCSDSEMKFLLSLYRMNLLRQKCQSDFSVYINKVISF